MTNEVAHDLESELVKSLLGFIEKNDVFSDTPESRLFELYAQNIKVEFYFNCSDDLVIFIRNEVAYTITDCAAAKVLKLTLKLRRLECCSATITNEEALEKLNALLSA